jgi:hypothetical protein
VKLELLVIGGMGGAGVACLGCGIYALCSASNDAGIINEMEEKLNKTLTDLRKSLAELNLICKESGGKAKEVACATIQKRFHGNKILPLGDVELMCQHFEDLDKAFEDSRTPASSSFSVNNLFPATVVVTAAAAAAVALV